MAENTKIKPKAIETLIEFVIIFNAYNGNCTGF